MVGKLILFFEIFRLNIRSARIDDIEQLKHFEQCVIEAERPFNQAIRDENVRYYDLIKLIEEDSSLLLVAEINGKLIASGYAQIRSSKPQFKHSQHGYLGFMYVAPHYRGQGINQKLTEQLTQWLKQKGIEYCYLDVYNDNQAAINAYEKLGFSANLLEMQVKI